MKKKLAGFGILMFFLFSLPLYAGEALDAVQDNVNKAIEVLCAPAFKTESATDNKKEKLQSIYVQLFNEIELSRRSLGRHWNTLNAAQRQEFVQLFRQVLEKAYMDKVLNYTDEKIVFDRETMLSSDQAEVQTRIITSSLQIAIIYRLILKEGAWKVYDVFVENVSLILNYRSQFNHILANNSAEQLLEILRKKVKEQ